MEGRCLWIQPDDVDGTVEEGSVVKATRRLNDFCLRGDDGSSPVEAGTLLEIVENRPWGASMAQELPALNAETWECPVCMTTGCIHSRDPHEEAPAIMQAMVELEAEGLWEFAPAESRG